MEHQACGGLTGNIIRNLSDRLYEKRKSAALEIEQEVKKMLHNSDTGLREIEAVMRQLIKDFAESPQANFRKGGLIGLAATAVGLSSAGSSCYLEELVPPVLVCFSDPDSRVRYYACESLYNIAKVARSHIIPFFNDLFDGLCKLSSDPDLNVKNGAQLLDRLVKDIVAESDAFDIDGFIPLLRGRIKQVNPFIRQFLIGWIVMLDSVPDIDLIEFLPEFLDGLFNMVSDPNKEIRQQADTALVDFLRDVQGQPGADLGRMVPILIEHCGSKDEFTTETAIGWIHEFVELGRECLLILYADILGAILPCTAHAGPSATNIQGAAFKTNKLLLTIVSETDVAFEIGPICETLAGILNDEKVDTRLTSMQWLNMLLEKMPSQLLDHLDIIFPALMQALSDKNDKVVHRDLEVLAQISRHERYFPEFMNELVSIFAQNRPLLQNRGSLIICKLCEELGPKKIYLEFAGILESQQDTQFAGIMVQTLNLIALTARELTELRSLLQTTLTNEVGGRMFTALYKSWCHNPVATFSLCLYAQAYQHAADLIPQFADPQLVTVPFLVQVDKLVTLLESPVFIFLRLQLLEPTQHPYLLKSLYGLLMLLPQSTAFNTLRMRLKCVPAAGILASPQSELATANSSTVDFVELLTYFKQRCLSS
jgi:vacuole morphology and inheritance protein 14